MRQYAGGQHFMTHLGAHYASKLSMLLLCCCKVL